VQAVAKAQLNLPIKFLEGLTALGDRMDFVIEEALEAGGEVLLSAARKNLSGAIGSKPSVLSDQVSSGELLGSLGLTPVQIDNKGIANIKVGFNEPRRNQYAQNKDRKGRPKTRSKSGNRSYYEITNAMIATVLEYGKHNQPPRPFLEPAKINSKPACIAAMKDVLEKETGALSKS